MNTRPDLSAAQKAHGQLLAADPAACAALNEVARLLRAWRMSREATA